MANTVQGRKAKGRLGQQEVRDMLLEAFPHLEEGDVRSTSMGASGVDIILSPLAKKSIPLSIEVKRRKDFKTQYALIDQAERNDGTKPVVFFRGDRKPWLVLLEADYYMELLKNGSTNSESASGQDGEGDEHGVSSTKE